MNVLSESWLVSNQLYLNYRIFKLLSQVDESFSDDTILNLDFSNYENIDSFHINILFDEYDLSIFEQNIILLAAGCELSSRFRDVLIKKLNLKGFTYLSFEHLFQLLQNPHWDAIGQNGKLRRNNLIKLFDGEPFLNRTYTIDESILQFLTGFSSISGTLFEVSKLYNEHHNLVDSHIALANYINSYLSINVNRNIVVLNGDTRDKVDLANHIAKSRGSELYIINAIVLPDSTEQISKLSNDWSKASKLNNAVLYLDCSSIDFQNFNYQKNIHQFLLNFERLVFIDKGSEGVINFDNIIDVNVKKPSKEEQIGLWHNLLQADKNNIELLKKVEQFNFSSREIFNIIDEFNIKKNELNEREENSKLLWEICSKYAKPKVHHLAYQLELKSSWHDLILPLKTKNILRDIINQVKYKTTVFETNGFNQKYTRNKGVSVLFTGESGTGKTMAAEVLATELNLNLYRIDLSQVINKYIGETEKNLKRIFDAAESGGCILLFDEADAIFGKRSEVKDSHDRYSNIQVGYLLQRMEEFEGVAILTTNMKNSFDKAFERRIRFIVPFERPDFELRKHIWESVFPDRTPIRELEYDKLAKINLPGGNIKNIALHASFLAAANGKIVTMEHLATATINEFNKMDKNISSNELKDWTCPKE